jgi:hypothetical protein
MKTKKHLFLSLSTFFFASTLLFSQTETRNIDSFDGIHVAGHYDVTLTNGNEGTLTLKGDADDLDQIETYVKKGMLIIKKKESSWFNNWKSGRVRISIPVEHIQEVVLSGSGSIQSNHELSAGEFEVKLSGSGEIDLTIYVQDLEGTLTGSGDIKLTGESVNSSFILTGSGDIDSSRLKTENGQARVTGSGNIEMQANSEINARITGSGDIVCLGNPQIQNIKTTGSGDVIIRD